MSGLALGAAALAGASVVAATAPGRAPARRVAALPAAGRARRAARGRSRRRRTHRVGLAIASGVGALGRHLRAAVRRGPDRTLDRRAGVAALVALAGLVLAPALAAPLALGAWVLPAWRRRADDRRRRAHLADEAPDVVELFRLAIGAGLTVHQAVVAVGARVRGASAPAVREIAAQVVIGHRLADALDRFGVTDEAVRPLAAALAAAERYGVPLGPTLDRLADDARHQRRRRAEEVARRLPVQMLFPLVLCILPAFALLTVVPLVLAAGRSLPI